MQPQSTTATQQGEDAELRRKAREVGIRIADAISSSSNVYHPGKYDTDPTYVREPSPLSYYRIRRLQARSRPSLPLDTSGLGMRRRARNSRRYV